MIMNNRNIIYQFWNINESPTKWMFIASAGSALLLIVLSANDCKVFTAAVKLCIWQEFEGENLAPKM